MLALLFNPDAVLGFTAGLITGGTVTAGLISLGFAAHERRTRLEIERRNASVRAGQSARAWGAGAANDDTPPRPRGARSQMRGGAR